MNLKLIKMRWTEQRNIGFGGSSWWRLQWFWCVVVMMGVAVVVGAGPVVRGDYTHEWAVHIEGGDDTAAREIARRHGFQVAYKVFDDIYVLRHRRLAKRSADPSPHHHQRLVEDPRVRWAEQQQVKRRNKRDYLSHLTGISYPNARLNDPKWPQMWYLNRGGSLDMNVQAAWAAGATGKDVVVTVLDDGLERDHPDLIKNYDPNASYDVNNHDHDPMPRYDLVDTNRHGTRIAGVVAADANNSICGVGVAYQASIGGIRMLDGDITDAVEARSLALNPQHIDIYSASWGPDDDGNTMEGPGQLATRAFVEGIRDGRGGKGSIFVWASGNGGHNQDNCNCDGYTNSIWTLSISSATERGQVPWYSEACSSTLATTYSSGSFGERQIITTDLHHSCTSSHTGTSASAPLAAGICALALQVNRDITWRDMQHIVVRTARPENLEASDWQINGVGRRVSHRFGYGLMDTYGMVKLARNWTSVPAQRTCDVEAPHIDKLIHQKSFVSMELDVTDCPGVNFLEHVQAKVSLTAARRGNIEIYLSSPAGTRSTLLARRPHDSSRSGFNNWPFMTVHMWGEQPLGKWVLEVHYNGHFFTTDNAGVKSWSLTMYGTESDPGQAVSSLHPHISYTDSSLHQVVDTTEDCTSLQWKCRSGDCINSNKRCDQTKQDCNDNSDEEGCPAGPAECGASQWQCTDKDCIEMKFRCDGLSHCKDGSDEVMCTTTCTPEQIYCGSGLCAADIGYCPPTTTTTTTIPTPVPCSSSQTHCGGGLCAAENIRCPNTTTTTTTTHNITATTTVITPTTTTTTTVISTTTATTPTTTTPTTTNTTTNTIIPTATTARGCGAESVVVWGRHLRLCTGPLRHLLSMLGQCWEGSDEDDCE